MIAGVVATLVEDARLLRATLVEIASLREIELGEFDDASRRIPLTIDSPSRNDMEALTRWLQQRPGVAFVDVVFVHLEEVDDRPSAANAADPSGRA